MPTTRPDYLEYVRALGLTAETAHVVDLLGRSEGRRQTDRIETVLAGERDASDRYVTHFLLRGVRHVEGAERVATTLRLGDRLDAAVEHEDKVNARARKLSFQGQPVGYAPDYLVGDLDQLERAAPTPSFTVARVNPPPAPAHHRVLVRGHPASRLSQDPSSSASWLHRWP